MRADITAGLVTAILVIAATISYSAAIFSGPLAAYLQVGIGCGLIGACLTALIFALFSGIPFAVGGPDSKPTAILATMTATVAAYAAAHGQSSAAGSLALLSLIVATTVTGVVLLVFSALRMGNWVRFVPYPVIAGFMAASGWLLIEGAVRTLTQTQLSWNNASSLAQLGPTSHLVAGVGFAMVMAFVSRRSRNLLALPGLLLGSVAIAHVSLWLSGVPVTQAQASGWLLKVPAGAILPMIWLVQNLHHPDLSGLLHLLGDFAALIVVTASTLLLSLTAVEVGTQMNTDPDMDRELRVNGIANLAAALFGGMIGTLSLSRTMFIHQNGGKHRLTGIIVAGVCLATLLFGTGILGYVPVPILGGMLLRLGWNMLDDWLLKGWKRQKHADFFQVVVIFVAIVASGFLAGIAVGLIIACITFAVNSSRIRVVKRELDRTIYASRLDRSPAQRRELVRHGNGIQILRLHGFIFFGSANHLILRIKELMFERSPGSGQMVLLDFREVLGLDSSAVMSLVRMRQFAGRESVTLVLSGLSPSMQEDLRYGGFLREDDPLLKVFPHLDLALEWCEDRLLNERANSEEILRSSDDWLVTEMGSREGFVQLLSYVETMRCEPGAVLFSQGDVGDELCLIYSGRVSVFFRSHEGKEVRIRSMTQQTIVGEMGVYRTFPRGASVVVDESSVVYRLTGETLARMESASPDVACAFHRFVIRTLAERLDFANQEVAALDR